MRCGVGLGSACEVLGGPYGVQGVLYGALRCP